MIASFYFMRNKMSKEFHEWFWTKCDILNADTNFAYNLAEEAWDKQQETVDEQHEMLVNQARTILEYQKKLKEFKELFEEAIYGNDGDVQSYYRKQLEDIENE